MVELGEDIGMLLEKAPFKPFTDKEIDLHSLNDELQEANMLLADSEDEPDFASNMAKVRQAYDIYRRIGSCTIDYSPNNAKAERGLYNCMFRFKDFQIDLNIELDNLRLSGNEPEILRVLREIIALHTYVPDIFKKETAQLVEDGFHRMMANVPLERSYHYYLSLVAFREGHF